MGGKKSKKKMGKGKIGDGVGRGGGNWKGKGRFFEMSLLEGTNEALFNGGKGKSARKENN